jgi:hypothetical protein
MDIASVRSVRGTSQRYQMQAHDRYITSPRQVHHRLSQIESLRENRDPLRHDARRSCSVQIRQQRRSHGTVPAFHPAAGDAHSVTASVAASMGWRRRSGSLPRRRYEQDQPAAQREQNAGEPGRMDARHAPARRAVRAPV